MKDTTPTDPVGDPVTDPVTDPVMCVSFDECSSICVKESELP